MFKSSKGIKRLMNIFLICLFLMAFSVVRSEGTEIDIMFVYENGATTWVNSNGGMTAFGQDVINRMNQAMQNSGINLTFRLVHSMTVNTTETDLSNALSSLRAGSGVYADVHTARETYKADLVAMFVDTGSAYGYVGLGYLLTTWAGSPSYAFTTNAIRSVAISHTLTHEVGHNLGAHHSKHQTSDPGPNTGFTNPSAPYSAGWYFTGTNGTRYHTIMAYSNDGYGNSYTSAPLFSSPLITYQGTTAGHAQDGDNARLIGLTKDIVANYRQASTTTYNLVVTKTGAGSGTVTSSPSGINCGSTCSASFNSGTSVTLTATAASNSTFGGWSGDCSGTSSTCTVTMDASKKVTASFDIGTTQCTYTISVARQTFSSAAGTGIVTLTPSRTNCIAEWNLTSDSSWINFTYTCGAGICTSRSISGRGGGTASFRVDANSGTTPRTGTISLTGGNSVTIRQDAGGSCTQCGISFTDVPTSSFSYNEILAIGCAGITQGCGVNLYCPSHNVSRAQMAAFIVRAKVGEPPADYCSSGSGFNDVSSSDVFCKYIKRLSELQITTGCGNGNYCPSDVVTRGQMAAFIIRALYGENFSYTTTPYFSDVPSSHVFFKYVQKMKDEGYTMVTGTYNVDGTVTREQMAAFLYRAFLRQSCGM